MTNFDKLVRWDADWYKSLSDEDCILCLTERQIYLVLMAIDPLTWARTRWTGDIEGLDFEGIKGELANALNETMTCEKLSQILAEIEILKNKIDAIYIGTGSGGTTINIEVTTLEDVFSADDQQAQLDDISSCDNDVIYSAVNQLIRFIHGKNEDFLQTFAQAGNAGEVADILLEGGMPVLESLLPFDEFAEYAGFLFGELIDEYDATVDEGLLQQTICDVFCIATAGGTCGLDYADVLNYFASKVPANFSTFTSTFLDLVQFAILGTMSGDEYFYYMCYFQLWIVYSGERFIGINNGFEEYAAQMKAGANSPDADWEIFCDPCDPVYWHHITRFEFGLAAWEIEVGNLVDGRIESEIVPGQGAVTQVKLTVPTSFDLRKIILTYEKYNGLSSGSDTNNFYVREVPGGAQTQWWTTSFQGNGSFVTCVIPSPNPGTLYREIVWRTVTAGVSDYGHYLDIVEMWGNNRMDYGVYASEIEPC